MFFKKDKKEVQKYYTGVELKEMVLKEHKMPKAANVKCAKMGFIVKPRGYIYDDYDGVDRRIILK